jgi:hypothetical protein
MNFRMGRKNEEIFCPLERFVPIPTDEGENCLKEGDAACKVAGTLRVPPLGVMVDECACCFT